MGVNYSSNDKTMAQTTNRLISEGSSQTSPAATYVSFTAKNYCF
jgi:hypothetical protein